MTVTVKLDVPLEERLRQRAASTGRSTSDVIRAALPALSHRIAGSASTVAVGREIAAGCLERVAPPTV